MFGRRDFLGALPLAAPAAAAGKYALCMHQTTLLGAGFRGSLEACAKAGIRFVEVIPAHVDEFVARESVAAARRLLGDLGIQAVSSGASEGSPSRIRSAPRPSRS